MMYWLIGLMIILTCGAVELNEGWSAKFDRIINIQCSADDADYCQYICNDEQSCQIEEQFCRNCAGTDLYLQDLFENMGNKYQNSGEVVDLLEFFDFLIGGDFISLTSRSIYNFVDYFDSPALRFRFQTLCNYQNEYPVVFLQTKGASRLPGKVRYVTCADRQGELLVFRMTDYVDVIIGE